MSSVKLDVLWSPVHSNKFITWGTEICLYEIADIKDGIRQLCEYVIVKEIDKRYLFVYLYF